MVQKRTTKSKKSTGCRIIKNPTSVKLLAQQIKIAADEYVAQSVTEKWFKELIIHYATHHGKKLFSANRQLNPTLLNRIGKKRAELVNIMLDDFQTSIF